MGRDCRAGRRVGGRRSERMRGAEEMQREGIIIAQEILAELQPFVQGVYMMPAFGRYDLVADVLDVLE